MADKYIRGSINASRAVAKLDGNEERFYRRMLHEVDDFGRFEYDPALIISKAFPVHDSIRETDIPRWCAACELAGLLVFYEIQGRKFFVLNKTEPPRAKYSKCPNPPDALIKKHGLYKSVDKCSQVQTNVAYSYSYSVSETESVKKRLNKLFNRPESHVWPYFEESTLVDLMKRPAFADELEALQKFKSKPDSYFPRSNEALMRDWSKTLDRARNHGDKKHPSKGGNF